MGNDATEAVCSGEAPNCYVPLEGLMDLLARKYAMQIICTVGAHGGVRFREIEEHLPAASTSTLSNRTSELVDAGLLDRERYDEVPPRVEYTLTTEGRELQEHLEPLLEWADGQSLVEA